MSTTFPVLQQVARPMLLPLKSLVLLNKSLVLLIATKSLTVPHNTGVSDQVLKFQFYLLVCKAVHYLAQVARLEMMQTSLLTSQQSCLA